jgi:DNA-binding CsgD family transcriptional regulator
MTELLADDYRRILDLLHEIEDSPDLSRFATRLLDNLRKVVDCDIAGYTEVSPSFSAGFTDPPNAMFPGLEELFARLQHQHPLIKNFAETRDGRAYQISDFLSPEEWEATEIYREIYAPMGVWQQMAIGLGTSNGTIVGVTVSKSDRTPFSERDREVLTLLGRHLSHAHAVAMRNQGRKITVRPLSHLTDMGLTQREAEVVRWVALGKTNGEIGAIFGISPRTVQKHLQKIYDKLGVQGRTAAGAIALGADPADHPPDI